MVIKPKTKTTTVKKPIKPKTVAKIPVKSVSSVETKDLQSILDLHSKHLDKLDKMFVALEGEIKDLKKMISSLKEEKINKTSTISVTKPEITRSKISAKKIPTSISKASSISSPVKTQQKSGKTQKKMIKGMSISSKKPLTVLSSGSTLNDLIEIPKDIPERINALTFKKIVTQTQLGKEVDVSQKVIHEIATRKKKDLHKEKIAKLLIVLKKFESS